MTNQTPATSHCIRSAVWSTLRFTLIISIVILAGFSEPILTSASAPEIASPSSTTSAGTDAAAAVPTPLTVSGTYYVDDVRTVLTSSATGNILQVADSSGFVVGDEVLVISMHYMQAGLYETAYISEVQPSSLTLTTNLVRVYNTGGPVMVQRVLHFTTVTVQAGGTLTAHPWDGQTGGVVFFRADSVVVEAGGKIEAGGIGYRGGAPSSATQYSYQGESYWFDSAQDRLANSGGGGGGNTENNPNGSYWATGGGGAGYGSAGQLGTAKSGPGLPGDGGVSYGTANLSKLFLGSGGGAGGAYGSVAPGGNGGGIIVIDATSSIQVNGTISANGATALDSADGGGSGGGAGGSIYLRATTLTLGSGNVTAQGGQGGIAVAYSGNRGDGGDGGDGRIRLDYDTLSGTALPTPGYMQTPMGSMPVPTPESNDLIVTSDAILNAGSYTFDTVQVTNNATLYLRSNITAGSGVTITAQNIQIDNGAKITADGLGYAGSYGNGAGPGGGSGTSEGFKFGAGGGHGGHGGNGAGYVGGNAYGSVYQPVTLGSGGGGGATNEQKRGGDGGGAIHLVVAGTLTVSGTLSANGTDGTGDYWATGGGSGGGAGGSIWVEAQTLNVNGNGKIQANGGSSPVAGGGAGGRIALQYTTGTLSDVAVQAFGGTLGPTQHGGPGTVYWAPADRLVINNNGNNGAAAGLISGNYTFNSIELTHYGHLDVLGTASSLILTSGANVTGDGTATLAAYGTLNVPTSLTIQNVALDIQGQLSSATDIVVGSNGGLTLRASTPLHTGPFTFNSIIVQATGKLTLWPNNNDDLNYGDDLPFELNVGTMTIADGGVVHSDGLGYKGTYENGSGPGGGLGCISPCGYTRGGGGGYGGKGGNGSNGFYGGAIYSDAGHADYLGSAGGRGTNPGANHIGADGGGAIHLTVNGALTVDGAISANGANGSGGKVGLDGFGGSGGGSGGSLQIVAQTLTGSGVIAANGGSSIGDGYVYGGGGGGGRIVVAFGNFSFTGKFQAHGGIGYNNGEDGTIYGLILPRSATLNLIGLDWREGAITACVPCVQQVTVGGPINTATGALEYSVTDLNFPALGGEMAFRRSYSTLATDMYTTTLGYGWTHNLDTRLMFQLGQALFKAHSANQYIFYDNFDGTYSPYPGIKATLTRSGSDYVITTSSQTTYTFDAEGKLITWTNATGHSWTYTYNVSDQLIQVESGARHISLAYEAGQLKTVSDHTGRQVTFNYDPTTGDLASVVDVNNKTWTYHYDGTSHRLTEVIDPLNRTIERTAYDSQGRAIQQFNGEGELVVSLTYNADGTTTVTDGLGHSTVHDYDVRNTLTNQTNALAASSSKAFDHNFHPTSSTDALNHTSQMEWSEDGANLTKTIDALGHPTTLEYNPLNNLTHTTDALQHTTVYTYTGTLLTSFADALGKVTFYEYTTAADAPQPPNLLKSVTDPNGLTTSYLYNEFGQRLTVTTPQGATHYSYDALGRVETVTDTLSLVTKYEYDNAGRQVKIIRNYLLVNGQVVQNHQNAYNLITTYVYDDAGRLTKTTDTLGHSNWTCYDQAGRVTRTVTNATGADPCAANYVGSGNPDEDRITETKYDEAGNVIATIDPANIVTRAYYDELNRPIVTISNLTVDVLTLLADVPAFDPAHPDQNVRSNGGTTLYDDAGNITRSVDVTGRVTYTCYDALNRPVKTIQNPTVADPCPDYSPSSEADKDVIQKTVYDEVGNVKATIDAQGIITRTYYDALNRPYVTIRNLTVAIDTPLDQVPAYSSSRPDENIGSQTFYDDSGRAYRQLDLATGQSNWTCYDTAGRVSQTVVNAVGSNPCAAGYTPSGQPDEDLITQYVYDNNGRQIATIAPDGTVSRTYYDEVGRRSAVTSNLVLRDAGGNPLPTEQALAETAPPDFSTQHPAENLTTRFEYDVLGRVAKTITAASSPQERADWTCYDALGRTVKTVANATGANPCDANYTPSGQPDEDLIPRTVYDTAGNAIAAIDANGVTTRTYYDALNRPMVVVSNLTVPVETLLENVPAFDTAHPDWNVRQTTRYDSAGRAFETVDNAGMVTHTNYDALGRAVAVVVNYSAANPTLHDNVTNLTTQTVYDKLGHATRQIDANALVTNNAYGVNAFEYDALGRLTAVIQNYKSPYQSTPDTNVRTEYTYDSHGNRLTVKDANGHITAFEYDKLDRLKKETDALGHFTTYAYGLSGQTVSKTDANGVTTTYAYDGARRLTDINYPDGTSDVFFDYDALGNRVLMTDGTGTTSWQYDGLNQPKQITQPNGIVVGYGYDALGNKTELVYADGKIVNYGYDALNRATEVIPNTAQWGSGAGNVAYAYNAFGQPASATLPNGVTTTYAYDTAHRLTGITHTQGVDTVASYTYTLDAVGNPAQVVENIRQPLTATPTPTDTPLVTDTPAASATATATFTATTTDTPSATATSASGTVTVQVSASSDDVNQDNTSLTTTSSTAWLGNASSTTSSYTGLRFNNLAIPPGATITSAHLEVFSSQSQWVSMSFNIAAEAIGNSPTFSTGNLPSQRTLTTQQVSHSSNVQWQASTWYSLNEMGPVVQEVVGRADWQSGNSLSIILKGTGGAWGRKSVRSFDGSPADAPKLVITYTTGGATATATATLMASNTPTPTATNTATVTPSNTPVGPTNTSTATASATPAPTATSGSSTLTTQVSASSDDVNQDNTSLTTTSSTVWLGNASSTTSSYTGLRFNNLAIPQGATITSAHLEVFSSQSQWLTMNFNIAAEAIGNSPTFSTGNLPSQRTLTTQQVSHSSNVQWQASTWYSLNEMGPVVQEVVSRADWQSGNSLSVILKGAGASWGRKSVASFDGSAAYAPKLVISYTTGGPTNTATATPSNTPTHTATSTATNTATNTPTPTATYTFTSTNTPTATYTFTPTFTATAGPPPEPTPILPNSDPPTLKPLFDWSTVAGATSYRLQVSTSDTFSTTVLNVTTTASAYQPTSNLPRNTLLFWRVNASNSYGAGPWSRVRHFFSPNPPSVPTLLSPANGALVSTFTPTLDWNDSAPYAATEYEVQLSTVSDFSSVLGRGQGGVTPFSQYTVTTPLAPNTTYYWRVRGRSSSGGTFQFSDWSAVRNFHTGATGFGGGGTILARFVQPKGPRLVADSALPQAPLAGGAAKGFASPLIPAQNGELTTTTITYTYDGLYRVKDAVYSTGEEFHYTYDAVGNVLEYTHVVGQLSIVTTYTYNEANQLLTAHASNETITWHYLYDNNGSLTDVIPNGTTPVTDARRYTYNAAGYLTRAETHDGTTYQPQAEMQYNGLGERIAMTGWQGEISLTTTYTLDLTRRNGVLSANASGNTTFYLYDTNGPFAELTTSWAYYLTDGTNTPRQMTDALGEVTLARSYTPWGEVRQQVGVGSFTWGYFGGLMDAATGLVYVGGGQYYDPATGRFLTPVNRDGTNPYVPQRGGDPLGAVLAPFALLALLGGRKRRGKYDRVILMLVLVVAVGGALAACDGQSTPTNSTPTTPGGTPPSTPTHPPTNTPQPPTNTPTETSRPKPTDTPKPTGTSGPTQTPSATLCPEFYPFDPMIGPLSLPRTNWRYYDAGTGTHLHDKRVEFTSTVLYWLRYYEGPDAWWKEGQIDADGLNHTLIKAWILQGEAGEFLNAQFAGLQHNPAYYQARDINSYLNDGFTPEKLAKYTYFFDPTLGQVFDDKDWQAWLRRPADIAVRYISTAGFSDAGDPTNWWGYNEIPCTERTAFNQAIDSGTAYIYANDLGRVQADKNGADYYLGTATQFDTFKIGKQGIVPDGACTETGGSVTRHIRAW
jgi:RHS repeat-associated protein